MCVSAQYLVLSWWRHSRRWQSCRWGRVCRSGSAATWHSSPEHCNENIGWIITKILLIARIGRGEHQKVSKQKTGSQIHHKQLAYAIVSLHYSTFDAQYSLRLSICFFWTTDYTWIQMYIYYFQIAGLCNTFCIALLLRTISFSPPTSMSWQVMTSRGMTI